MPTFLVVIRLYGIHAYAFMREIWRTHYFGIWQWTQGDEVCFILGEEVTLELVQLSPCSKESQSSWNTESVASALNGVLMCYITACILKLENLLCACKKSHRLSSMGNTSHSYLNLCSNWKLSDFVIVSSTQVHLLSFWHSSYKIHVKVFSHLGY